MDNRLKISRSCGNCGHDIEVLSTSNYVFDRKSGRNKKVTTVYDVRHSGNSCVCLHSNCQCMDAIGRDTKGIGARYPFNGIGIKNWIDL